MPADFLAGHKDVADGVGGVLLGRRGRLSGSAHAGLRRVMGLASWPRFLAALRFAVRAVDREAEEELGGEDDYPCYNAVLLDDRDGSYVVLGLSPGQVHEHGRYPDEDLAVRWALGYAGETTTLAELVREEGEWESDLWPEPEDEA